MNQHLSSYYRDRAKEYDKVYQIPAEQEDLVKAAALFQQLFKNKSVLEIACGTGYWTEQIAKTADSILATDINESVIAIARTRDLKGTVQFEVADMYDLKMVKGFEGIFGGFIWSHILLQDLDKWLIKIKSLLVEHGEIVFIDSKPVAGTNHDKSRISRTDQFGNTFQTRILENGTQYEVLKNFPAQDFLVQKLSSIAANIQYIELDHYWIVTGNRHEQS